MMKEVAVDANIRQRPILLDMLAKLRVKVQTRMKSDSAELHFKKAQ